MTLSALIGRFASFAAQLALGWLLADGDFGEFAAAIAIASYALVFRDNGAASVLVQRGSTSYDRIIGAAFWLHLTLGALAALALSIAAPALANALGQPSLPPLLWIIAVSIPLSAPSAILRAKLRIDLRFQAVALIATISFLIRHVGAVAFAAFGFGAQSFVWPLLILAMYENVAAYLAVRESPWARGFGFRQWGELLGNSLWGVVSASFWTFNRTGDYLILSMHLGKALLGRYFFGYQVSMQLAALLSINLTQVLLPLLSRLAADEVRFGSALFRTVRVVSLVTAPASIALALTIGPLETLLWQGRWSATVPLMQILSVAAPLRIFPAVLHSALQARGTFSRSAWYASGEGVALAISTVAGIMWFDYNITGIAATISAGQVAFSLLMGFLVFASFGVPARRFLAASFPAWIISMISAGAALALSNFAWPDAAAWQVLLRSVAFVVCFLLQMRLFCSNHLADFTNVAPAPAARLIRSVLRLDSA